MGAPFVASPALVARADMRRRNNSPVGRRAADSERGGMDAFYERLIVRAATIDELLSADFEPLPGQKGDTDVAARRLAAWCRSCASGAGRL